MTDAPPTRTRPRQQEETMTSDAPVFEVHDLTRRGWGNDFAITSADPPDIRMVVWRSARIAVGDLLLIPRDGGRTIAYEVLTHRQPTDPGDQHFITARHVPMAVK